MLAWAGPAQASPGAPGVVLQHGVLPAASYAGCQTATLWQGAAKAPDGDKALYLRGESNRMLLRFDLPAELKGKALARARLWVFLPKAANENRYTEIVCNGMAAAWDKSATWANATAAVKWASPGGDFDNKTAYHNGRFLGATDSVEIYAHQQAYWIPHMTNLPVGVPEGGMWVSFNVTPLAEKWLASPAANNGVMLSCTHADKRMPNPWEIDIPSENSPDLAHRPKLELEVAAPPAQAVLVGLIPTLQRVNAWSSRYDYPPQPQYAGANVPKRPPYSTDYTVQMAANEWEGFQAVVYPMLADLNAVKFTWNDLTDAASGAKLPKDCLRWYCQDMVLMASGNWVVRDVCLGDKRYYLPDPLVPAELAPQAWKDVRRQQATPFWFTVHAPPGTKPGMYKTALTLSADPGAPGPVTCNLTVQVWDYEIPTRWNFSIVGGFGVGELKRFYGKDWQEAWYDRWIDFLIDHRLAPTEQYATNLSPRADRLKHCVDRGLNVIYVQGNLKPASDMQTLAKQYEVVKSQGLTDHAFIYVEDEGHQQEMRRQLSRKVRQAAPEAMMMVGGARPDPEVWGFVDVWDPEIDSWPGVIEQDQGGTKVKKDKLTPAQARQVVEACQARGERFFWYVAASPTPPLPNVHLEDSLIAARVFLWMSWKYRVEGTEYYCYNLWGNNMKNPRWPAVPWDVRGFKDYNCDGILYYPGPEGTPCSSVRLEGMRDGVEDWESFYILRDYADALRLLPKNSAMPAPARQLLATADKLLDVPDHVVAGLADWTQDPELLMSTRAQLGATIVAMKQFVTQAQYEKFRDARQADRLARQRQMLKDRVEGKLPATQPVKEP